MCSFIMHCKKINREIILHFIIQKKQPRWLVCPVSKTTWYHLISAPEWVSHDVDNRTKTAESCVVCEDPSLHKIIVLGSDFCGSSFGDIEDQIFTVKGEETL